MLGATLFNIIVAILSFFALLLLYGTYVIPRMSESSQQWGFSIIFLLSLGISFLVYRAVLKFLLTKIEFEKYFDPIFVRKYKKPPPKT